jgi:hypothetical protein
VSGTAHLAWRRLILELGQASADEATLRLAGEFARGLGLDLHGLFIQDEALLHLAALPFAREIRLPSHQWQRIDAYRLETELQHATEAARQRLRQIVGELGIYAAFEVVRGEPHRCIAGVCTPADIIVIPVHEEVPPYSVALLRAAAQSPASVLLIPRHVVRNSGPIAVVASGPEDAELSMAARIAETVRDRLVVVIPDAGPVPAPEPLAAAIGFPPTA